MNIAIIGYGKMGKEIEKIALERGHKVPLKINSKNAEESNAENMKVVDAAIEFTNPDLAVPNIHKCIDFFATHFIKVLIISNLISSNQTR